MTLSFQTAKDMFARIQQHMPHGPAWKSSTVTLPDAPNEPQIFFYRDIIECVKFLFGNPKFRDSMVYEPYELYEEDGKTRVYHEMYTGKCWNELQVSCEGIDKRLTAAHMERNCIVKASRQRDGPINHIGI